MTYERSDGRGTCQIEDIARPCAKIGIPIFATHEPVAVNPVLDTPANSPTSQDAICFKRWMMPSSGGCTATRWLSKKKIERVDLSILSASAAATSVAPATSQSSP